MINTTCKLISKGVDIRVSGIYEGNKILIKAQAGLRRLEECVCQATCLYEFIKRRKLKGETTFVAFHDLSKEYDRVTHAGLLFTLKPLGLHGKLYRFIETLYKDLKSSVRVNDSISVSFFVRSQSRQRSPIFHMLFKLYINDLFEKMHGIYIRDETIPELLYANETVLLADSADKM
ncbi:Retrovirus-related Pol polyprotein from type-1 retrotransposable element R2 [Dictyocoela muelleri]|nr:Retrovirus-related Pol polyprotein from type-1 retrotransposable element R2 [Dictyocoela muelleri]